MSLKTIRVVHKVAGHEATINERDYKADGPWALVGEAVPPAPAPEPIPVEPPVEETIPAPVEEQVETAPIEDLFSDEPKGKKKKGA